MRQYRLVILVFLLLVPTEAVGQSADLIVDSTRFEHLEDSTWTTNDPLKDLSSQHIGALVKEGDNINFTVFVGERNGGYLIALGTVQSKTQREQSVSTHRIEDVILVPGATKHHRIGVGQCSVGGDLDRGIIAVFEYLEEAADSKNNEDKESSSCGGPRGSL